MLWRFVKSQLFRRHIAIEFDILQTIELLTFLQFLISILIHICWVSDEIQLRQCLVLLKVLQIKLIRVFQILRSKTHLLLEIKFLLLELQLQLFFLLDQSLLDIALAFHLFFFDLFLLERLLHPLENISLRLNIIAVMVLFIRIYPFTYPFHIGYPVRMLTFTMHIDVRIQLPLLNEHWLDLFVLLTWLDAPTISIRQFIHLLQLIVQYLLLLVDLHLNIDLAFVRLLFILTRYPFHRFIIFLNLITVRSFRTFLNSLAISDIILHIFTTFPIQTSILGLFLRVYRFQVDRNNLSLWFPIPFITILIFRLFQKKQTHCFRVIVCLLFIDKLIRIEPNLYRKIVIIVHYFLAQLKFQLPFQNLQYFQVHFRIMDLVTTRILNIIFTRLKQIKHLRKPL